jgi:hypothetical protein
VIHAEVPLAHDFFQVSKAEAESEIPTDAEDDDLGFEMSSPKLRWPVLSHIGRSLSDPLDGFATVSVW